MDSLVKDGSIGSGNFSVYFVLSPFNGVMPITLFSNSILLKTKKQKTISKSINKTYFFLRYNIQLIEDNVCINKHTRFDILLTVYNKNTINCTLN